MSTVKITDVARAAGVSPATVSYVLSGKRTISKKTKKKVRRIIEKMGYIPNANAQALKSHKNMTVGLLVSDFKEPAVPKIILGVEKVARDKNYHIFYTSGTEFDSNIREAVSFLTRRRLDGLIVVFGITSNYEEHDLDEIDLPLVCINTPMSKRFPTVYPDNFKGGYEAGEHLLASGCRRPAMIAGPRSRFASEQRLAGFTQALQDRELELPDECLFFGDFEYQSGKNGLTELIKRNGEIDGIFCADDMMAAGAMNAAWEHKLSVPGDIKILGFDNLALSAIWPVPISTFSQPVEEMGRIGIAALFNLIENKTLECSTIKVECTLLPRESTGYPSA